MQKKNIIVRIAIIVGLIMVIPVLGNLFIDGWNWSNGDFIVMGTLLFGTGLAIDLAARKIAGPVWRSLAIIAIVLALILAWAELAIDGVSQALALLF